MQPGLSQCRDAVSAHGEAKQGAQHHGSGAHPEKAHGRQRPKAEHARNGAVDAVGWALPLGWALFLGAIVRPASRARESPRANRAPVGSPESGEL